MKDIITLIEVAQESLVKQLADPSNLFTATINVPSLEIANRLKNSFITRGGVIGNSLINGKTGFVVTVAKSYATRVSGEWWEVTVSPDTTLDDNSRA